MITLKELQKEYNDGSSIRKLSKKYGYTRYFIEKNLKIRRKKPTTKTKSDYVSDWRKRAKIKLLEYKGGKCLECGYKKSTRALEFHHIDPNKKDFQISGISISYERLKNETDKCILVCSNCHCEIHDGLLNIEELIIKEENRKGVTVV